VSDDHRDEARDALEAAAGRPGPTGTMPGRKTQDGVHDMAAPVSSVPAVLAALSGNLLVTLLKLVAFVLSGSGAMLSETIHSAADTGNQMLLFLGLKRGARARDEDFHYGYGSERFVFGILSASGIFFVGCGVTIYHGIHQLLEPAMPTLSAVTFAVLGVSFLIEGGVLLFAVRSIARQRGALPFFRYVREGADPASVAVLLEDGAAVLGLLLAALGIGLAYLTGNPLFDALATILIGLLLGAVAVYLVIENRALLLGKAVPDDVEAKFLEILRSWPSVRSVQDVKTRQITPELYTLKAEVTFHERHLADKLQLRLSSEPAEPGEPRDRFLRRVAAIALRSISEDIDAIERAVCAAIPQAKHIDIEIDHRSTDAAAPPSPPREAP
jgi:zinc transporter 9